MQAGAGGPPPAACVHGPGQPGGAAALHLRPALLLPRLPPPPRSGALRTQAAAPVCHVCRLCARPQLSHSSMTPGCQGWHAYGKWPRLLKQQAAKINIIIKRDPKGGWADRKLGESFFADVQDMRFGSGSCVWGQVKLGHDVRHNLARPTAWEAVMRIRCSKGLRISAFHGHFFIRSSDLLALPQVLTLTQDPSKPAC